MPSSWCSSRRSRSAPADRSLAARSATPPPMSVSSVPRLRHRRNRRSFEGSWSGARSGTRKLLPGGKSRASPPPCARPPETARTGHRRPTWGKRGVAARRVCLLAKATPVHLPRSSRRSVQRSDPCAARPRTSFSGSGASAGSPCEALRPATRVMGCIFLVFSVDGLGSNQTAPSPSGCVACP